MNERLRTYAEALKEGLDVSMQRDPRVFVMGLGVPDPKGIFGSTLGLREKHGKARVMDMPTAENGMTGIAIGAALTGMRPVMTHQRVDFAILSVEQIVNQAAKWHYMFGGLMRVPLVIRMIVGRGWGQGPQHSQSLQSWYAHIPGLRVIMPTTPRDAKGMLITAIEDDNPVIVLEHRWLYNLHGEVPDGHYRVPFGKAAVMREGTDVTIASISYMSIEAMRAAEHLAKSGIEAEVIDMRCLRPLDSESVITSVRKTGHLVVADTGWKSFGVSAEILSVVVENAFTSLKAPPVRIALPECPTPTSPSIANALYPRANDIVDAVASQLGRSVPPLPLPTTPLDVPDPTFVGPF